MKEEEINPKISLAQSIPNQKKSKIWLFGVIMSILILAFIAYFLFFYGDKKGSNQNVQEIVENELSKQRAIKKGLVLESLDLFGEEEIYVIISTEEDLRKEDLNSLEEIVKSMSNKIQQNYPERYNDFIYFEIEVPGPYSKLFSWEVYNGELTYIGTAIEF